MKRIKAVIFFLINITCTYAQGNEKILKIWESNIGEYDDKLRLTVLKSVKQIEILESSQIKWINESGDTWLGDYKTNTILAQTNLGNYVTKVAEKTRQYNSSLIMTNQGLIETYSYSNLVSPLLTESKIDDTHLIAECEDNMAICGTNILQVFSKKSKIKVFELIDDFSNIKKIMFYAKDKKILLSDLLGKVYSINLYFDKQKMIVPYIKNEISDFDILDDILVVYNYDEKLTAYDLNTQNEIYNSKYTYKISKMKILPSLKGVIFGNYYGHVNLVLFDKTLEQNIIEEKVGQMEIEESTKSQKLTLENDIHKSKVYYYLYDKNQLDSFDIQTGQKIANFTSNNSDKIAVADIKDNILIYTLNNDSFKLTNRTHFEYKDVLNAPDNNYISDLDFFDNSLYYSTTGFMGGLNKWDFNNLKKESKSNTPLTANGIRYKQIRVISKDIFATTNRLMGNSDSIINKENFGLDLMIPARVKNNEVQYKKLYEKTKNYEAYIDTNHSLIAGIEFNKSRNWLIIARKTGLIEIYDLVNAKIIKSYHLHSMINGFKPHSDNSFFCLVDSHKVLKIEGLFQKIDTIYSCKYPMLGLSIFDNKLVIFGNNVIEILDSETFKIERKLDKLNNINKLTSLPNTLFWANKKDDDEPPTPILLHQIPKERNDADQSVSTITFNKKGDLACIGLDNGKVIIYRVGIN